MPKLKSKSKPKARRFKWGGTSFPVPAQVVGEELATLFPNGNIETHAVVGAASDPKSPLHACFEWDDEAAANQHRLTQARKLVSSIHIVVTTADKEVRSYAYVHVTDSDGPRYVEAGRLATDGEIRTAAIREVLAQLEGLKRRYNFIDELGPVFHAAEKVRKKLAG